MKQYFEIETFAIINSNLKSIHFVVSGLISLGYGHVQNKGAAVFNGFNYLGPFFVSVVLYVGMSASQSKPRIMYMKLLE